MGFIQDKINEIRKKPEHIRIRYAWACAAGVTFLVIIIWIFSLSSKNQDEIINQEFFTPEQMKPIEDLKTSGSELKNATEKLKESVNNPQNQQKLSDPQNSGEGFGQ
jgi:ABC-type glycerol-3-phosphate transport system permease component